MTAIRRLTLLFLLCTLGTASTVASASQWHGLELSSVEIKGYVPETDLLVTVFAELDRTSQGRGDTAPTHLRALRVSYAKWSVKVPREILALAPDPLLERIDPGYCCWGVVPGEGDVHGDADSTFAVSIPYGDPYVPERKEGQTQSDEPVYPSLWIHIVRGRVTGFAKGHYDGTDWVSEWFSWDKGRIVPVTNEDK